MIETVVSLKNISKYYTIYSNPKDRLKELIFRKSYHREFWALKDINLTIPKGETLGIIGNNGAGKSTLLKILSKTLTPSHGEFKIVGRVSPILELGTGFHPELTGAENIYLAGKLLSLSNKDIQNKFDEIVAFSELGDFINQPVKTYSSGMYVRLAFSVATCADPDILIIDEALSVGDGYFQKKSLNKILEFKQAGKNIIFCSHNMYHITHICNRAVWIENGSIRKIGNVFDVVSDYEEASANKGEKNIVKADNNPLVTVKSVTIAKNLYQNSEDIKVSMRFENKMNLPIHAGLVIMREDGTVCFGTSTFHDNLEIIRKKEGEVSFLINKNPFTNGKYQIIFAVIDETANLTYDSKGINFEISKSSEELGFLRIEHEWKVR